MHLSRFRSRPSFLVVMLVAGTAGTATFGALAERCYDPKEARAALLAEAEEKSRAELLELGFAPLSSASARALRRATGVEVLSAESPFAILLGDGEVAGQVAHTSDVERAVSVLAEELGHHPRTFITKARLSRVLLCRGLREAEKSIPSLPNYQRSLLLDVEQAPDFLRRLIHHELFHFADYAEDDQVRNDPEWQALGEQGFVYGSGGRFQRDPRSSLPAGAPAGFVTPYATSALEEDKAETFSFLFVAPGALAERSRHDATLAAKLQLLRRELERFTPELRSHWSTVFDLEPARR